MAEISRRSQAVPLRALGALFIVSILHTSLRAWRNWQTRRIQVPVAVRSWRFDSSRPHSLSRDQSISVVAELRQFRVLARVRLIGGVRVRWWSGHVRMAVVHRFRFRTFLILANQTLALCRTLAYRP